jgi:hypothetical protein
VNTPAGRLSIRPAQTTHPIAQAGPQDGIEVHQEELDAGLRQVLRERLLPEFIEHEFERIMRAVFN